MQKVRHPLRTGFPPPHSTFLASRLKASHLLRPAQVLRILSDHSVPSLYLLEGSAIMVLRAGGAQVARWVRDKMIDEKKSPKTISAKLARSADMMSKTRLRVDFDRV